MWSKLLMCVVVIGLVALSALPAQAVSQQAVLSWTDLPNDEGYVIERKAGPSGTYAQVSAVAKDVVSYTDPDLPQGTNFCWRVAGKNTIGTGAFSDEVCVSTAGVPGKVGGLKVIIQIVP
jgi:hypothetical protein